MEEKQIGTVTHYFTNINVGIIQLSDTLKVGDTLHFKGHTSDFTQLIDSMQIEHTKVQEAKAGDAVGIKVKDHVRQHDTVYKVTG
ncbi:MAG: translation elongation factor-like protein [Candidatus Omnitrophota bacterium]